MNRIHQKMSLEQKIQALKLLLHMTLKELKSRITFKGLNPFASECVLTALRRRHLAITIDQAKRLESSVEI